MKKLYTLCLLLAINFVTNAQLTTDYNAKWFLGFNAGATWHTTDVENTFDAGAGFTLGRSFNYNYGRILSFDIRARYLHGYWQGQNTDTSSTFYLNDVLSQGATNYLDTFGYNIRNFQTENYRLAAELVIHANRLRERTRWDAYIFGGIGLTWSQTMGDYLTRDSVNPEYAMYDYDLSKLSKSYIRRTQDEIYETALAGSNKDKFNLNVMPSLGFGFGYQVGKSVTIGFEHKTTFTGIDNFDGVVQTSKYGQDIYHYSNAYIQFRLGGRKKDKIIEDNNESQPPRVTFTNPSRSGNEVGDSAFNVLANINFVFDQENVTFTHNGQFYKNFFYNANSDRFSANVILVSGQNTFELTGVNQFGTDTKSTIVIYKRRLDNNDQPSKIDPPVVSFIQPNNNPLTVNNANYTLIGKVINVGSKSEIQLKYNGVDRSDFTYNTTTKEVRVSLVLNLGNNVVELRGTNSVGTDVKSTTIIYQRQNQDPGPVVYFVDPANSPTTLYANNFVVKGKIFNVSNSQNVMFKQNGTARNSFSFNPTTQDFSCNVVLVPGQNIFELYGTNSTATVSATTNIIYDRQAPKPPVVSITQPSSSNTTASSSNYQFFGTVLNVTQKSQVGLVFNGQNMSNFSFNFNNGQANAALLLVEGNNVVRLLGTNADGMDAKEVVIVYRAAQTLPAPVVTFVNPSSNPMNVNATPYQVNVKIENVQNISGTAVKANGQTIQNYTFNNGLLNVNLNVKEGANVIEVTGTNASGSDSKSSTIFYRKPQTVYPPEVKFIDPAQSPISVNSPSYALEAEVKNVDSKSNIELKINGQATTGFTYSLSSRRMYFGVNLIEGSNLIEIKGMNAAGNDVASTVLVYRKPVPKEAPTVSITHPSRTPYSVSYKNFTVEANVDKVNSANDLTVLVNGQSTGSFNYVANTNKLTLDLVLIEGSNVVKVSATTDGGTASDETNIVYSKPVVVQPPSITYINPSKAYEQVANSSFTLKVRIFRVDNKSQVVLNVNGQVVDPSKYSFDESTKDLTHEMNLNIGTTQFELIVANAGGTVSASSGVKYVKSDVPCDKPIVTINSPVKSPVDVKSAKFNFAFDVTKVNASSDVSMKLNGVPLNGTLNNNLHFQLNAILIVGANVFEVVAVNACGQTNVTTTVNFTEENVPCENPTVNLVMPTLNSSNVDTRQAQIKFGVAGAANVSSISLKVNGQPNVFAYDGSTRTLDATLDLNIGENKILVSATNACGNVSKEISITRINCQAPTLQLVSSNIENGGKTYDDLLDLTLAVGNINDEAQLKVMASGKQVGFNYIHETGLLDIDIPLGYGTIVMTVTATNVCGTKTYTHIVLREKGGRLPAPKVSFKSPIDNPSVVANGILSFEASVTDITSMSQVKVILNNETVAFKLDLALGKVLGAVNLQTGGNDLKIEVVNSTGSAIDSRYITFAQPFVQSKPEITVEMPKAIVTDVKPGLVTISGKVKNLESTNQLVIRMNGRILTNIKKTIVNGELIFTTQVNVQAETELYTLNVRATNSAGVDSKIVQLKLESDVIKARIKKPAPSPIPVRPTGGRKN
jgi:hypothetical protein